MKYYAFSIVGFGFFWNPLLRYALFSIESFLALYLQDIASASCIVLYFATFISDFFPQLLKIRIYSWNVAVFICLCIFPSFLVILQPDKGFWIVHSMVSNFIVYAVLSTRKYLAFIISGFVASLILHIICHTRFCLSHSFILYIYISSGVLGVVFHTKPKISDEKKLHQLKVNLERYKFFTQYISHELRIPLQGIRGVAGLLISKANSGLQYNLEYYLNILQASCTQLLIVASGILDFSKFTSQYSILKTEKCDLKHIIDGVALEMKALSILQNTKINVYCDLPEVYMDSSKVTHILRNLVSNALRSTKNGTINIQAFLMHREKLHISVTDTGVGIDAQEVNKIFDKFTQTSSESNLDSSGIGLFIVSHFVQLHKGKIWVEPNLPQGTIFSLQFEEVFSVFNQNIKQKSLMNPNIENIFWHNVTWQTLNVAKLWMNKVTLCALVIDDDELSLLSSKLILENAGFIVLQAKNCSTAVSILKDQKVHLLLLDIVIGKDNITECLNQIVGANSEISIILQSGMNQSFARDIARYKGVVAYLFKPYGPQDLEKILTIFANANRPKD